MSEVLPGSAELSFVVPVYNEAESLETLYREIVAAGEASGHPFEILFVDDGSRDDTPGVLNRLSDADARVRVASFRRNFGKSAALAVAFAQVRGRLVMTLDGDLQDDPAELPALRAALEERGLDLVSGWKATRRDPWTKTVPSRLFNAVAGRVTGARLHDLNCGLKLYRREVVEALEVYGELHRFLPALAHLKGFRIGEVPVRHRARQFGYSKFGAARFVNGFLDLLAVSFIQTSALKPLHVFGRIGLLSGIVGGGIAAYFLVIWALGEPLRVRPLLILAAVLLILGIQFVSLGLLGELIATQHPKTNYPLRAQRRWGGSDTGRG